MENLSKIHISKKTHNNIFQNDFEESSEQDDAAAPMRFEPEERQYDGEEQLTKRYSSEILKNLLDIQTENVLQSTLERRQWLARITLELEEIIQDTYAIDTSLSNQSLPPITSIRSAARGRFDVTTVAVVRDLAEVINRYFNDIDDPSSLLMSHLARLSNLIEDDCLYLLFCQLIEIDEVLPNRSLFENAMEKDGNICERLSRILEKVNITSLVQSSFISGEDLVAASKITIKSFEKDNNLELLNNIVSAKEINVLGIARAISQTIGKVLSPTAELASIMHIRYHDLGVPKELARVLGQAVSLLSSLNAIGSAVEYLKENMLILFTTIYKVARVTSTRTDFYQASILDSFQSLLTYFTGLDRTSLSVVDLRIIIEMNKSIANICFREAAVANTFGRNHSGYTMLLTIYDNFLGLLEQDQVRMESNNSTEELPNKELVLEALSKLCGVFKNLSSMSRENKIELGQLGAIDKMVQTLVLHASHCRYLAQLASSNSSTDTAAVLSDNDKHLLAMREELVQEVTGVVGNLADSAAHQNIAAFVRWQIWAVLLELLNYYKTAGVVARDLCRSIWNLSAVASPDEEDEEEDDASDSEDESWSRGRNGKKMISGFYDVGLGNTILELFGYYLNVIIDDGVISHETNAQKSHPSDRAEMNRNLSVATEVIDKISGILGNLALEMKWKSFFDNTDLPGLVSQALSAVYKQRRERNCILFIPTGINPDATPPNVIVNLVSAVWNLSYRADNVRMQFLVMGTVDTIVSMFGYFLDDRPVFTKILGAMQALLVSKPIRHDLEHSHRHLLLLIGAIQYYEHDPEVLLELFPQIYALDLRNVQWTTLLEIGLLETLCRILTKYCYLGFEGIGTLDRGARLEVQRSAWESLTRIFIRFMNKAPECLEFDSVWNIRDISSWRELIPAQPLAIERQLIGRVSHITHPDPWTFLIERVRVKLNERRAAGEGQTIIWIEGVETSAAKSFWDVLLTSLDIYGGILSQNSGAESRSARRLVSIIANYIVQIARIFTLIIHSHVDCDYFIHREGIEKFELVRLYLAKSNAIGPEFTEVLKRLIDHVESRETPSTVVDPFV